MKVISKTKEFVKLQLNDNTIITTTKNSNEVFITIAQQNKGKLQEVILTKADINNLKWVTFFEDTRD